MSSNIFIFFFFHDTATTEIYTLSLHDALPISPPATVVIMPPGVIFRIRLLPVSATYTLDRKSTRLNSSHVKISYAVFCLKKKKNDQQQVRRDRFHSLRAANEAVRRESAGELAL